MLIKGVFAALALLFGIAAQQANAAPVSVQFAFLDSTSATIASGNFSYDNSLNGTVIGYGDLDTFLFDLGTDTYDLAFLNGGGFGVYYGMAFDTVSHTFNTLAPDPVFPFILAAVLADFSNGFFVRPENDIPVITEYPRGSGLLDAPYSRVVVSVNAVPLPAALPLLGAGLAGLGIMGWVRMRTVKVVAT